MIDVSTIKLIGAIVGRTRIAMSSNLYYYPGTYEEIKNAFDKANIGERDFRFPSVLFYQPSAEIIKDGIKTIQVELGFIHNSNNEWSTEEREVYIFQEVLEPIFNEFLNQIKLSGYFQIPYEGINYTKIKVFTTGQTMTDISKDLYGDTADLIRIRNLSLTIKDTLCKSDLCRIEREYQESYK